MRSKRHLAALGSCATIAAALLILLVATSSGGDDEDTPRQRLANLSATEQEELRRKRETFEVLDESEQQRMRQLHTAIHDSGNAQQLRSVMVRYHEWLTTLTSKERADLAKLPPAERIEKIKRLMEQQRQQRFRSIVKTLPPEDTRVLFRWMHQYIGNHEEELIGMLPQTIQQRIDGAKGPASMKNMMLIRALSSIDPDAQLPAPTEEEIDRLNAELSSKAQAVLAELPTREEKLQLVRDWVRAAVAHWMSPQISRKALLDFHQRHKDDPRLKQRFDQLEGLPPDEFYEEVKQLYLRHRGNGRGWRDGEHRGPPAHSRDDLEGSEHRRGGDRRGPPADSDRSKLPRDSFRGDSPNHRPDEFRSRESGNESEDGLPSQLSADSDSP